MGTTPGTVTAGAGPDDPALPDRLRARLIRSRGGTGDRRLLVVAAAIFVVAFAFALSDLPVGALEPRWGFVVLLAVVGVPAQVLVNALEYVVTGAVRAQRIGLRPAAEVAVLSSAANLLPIPGAALVRVRALRRLGWTTRHAVGATALVGAAWLATTLAVAGGVVAVAGADDGPARALAVGLAVAGTAGCVVVGVLVARAAGPGRGPGVAGAVLAVEVLAVAVGALRYLLAFAAIGAGVDVAQAVALTVATVVASAVGFFPGGLGLRELLAGAISPVVGVPAAVGLVGVAVDRLVGLAVLGALALGLLRRSGDAG